MSFAPQIVVDALRHVIHPAKGKDIVSLGMVDDDLAVEGSKVKLTLIFDRENDPVAESIKNASVKAIKAYVLSEIDVEVNIRVKARPKPIKISESLLPGVKNIVAVASGKGGVGKSTVATNLAVAVASMGYKTGLLDADIFGPSIPKMFATEDSRPVIEKINGKDRVVPVEKHGVKLLSMGYFVNPDDALVWRGAMATNALKQIISDGYWGELDYLFIDMPPGTSDIHLTIVQTIALTGAVIVSTPQEVALADARKGISMFTGQQVNVPLLGLVENMAWFTPAELPESKYYIFGKDGCKKLAEAMNLPLLGQIPLVQGIREGGDDGLPPALDTGSVTGKAFNELAKEVIEAIDNRNRELPPTRVVQVTRM